MQKNLNHKIVVRATDPLHYLTNQQRMFVDAIVKGDSPQLAARKAGYSNPDSECRQVLKGPKIEAAIRFAYQKYALAAQMTRKRVMDGLIEAIEMAKLQSDPAVMVSGWREIGKMCGFYAPEVKQIDISVTTRQVVDQLETLSDDDLLKLVDEGSQLIEGEAEEVLNELDYARAQAQIPEQDPRLPAQTPRKAPTSARAA